MPLIDLQNEPHLWISLPGTYRIGNTDYKRKLRVTTLIDNQSNRCVITEAEVTFFYQGENDTFGELAETSLTVKNYLVKMIADNSTVCDLLTGVPICQTADIGDETDPASPLFEVNGCLQYEWFFKLAKETPVIVHDFIKNFFLYHHAIGKCD